MISSPLKSSPLNFEIDNINTNLIQGVIVKKKQFNLLHVFTRCNTNKNEKSILGIMLYILTICMNFFIGYSIYRAQDIEQTKLSNVDLYGDLCMVAFIAFALINFNWHSFEKLTCLGKDSCCLGFIRYFAFVCGTVLSTVVYGSIRNIPFFQSSLNSNLTDGQWWLYFAVFTVVFFINVYWFIKLFDFKFTKRCCKPKYANKLIFVRLWLAIIVVNILSYFVCKADTCSYHLHHFHFGLCLIILSTPFIDNWFDMVLQGVFWMFLLESQWNYSVSIDKFFI